MWVCYEAAVLLGPQQDQEHEEKQQQEQVQAFCTTSLIQQQFMVATGESAYSLCYNQPAWQVRQ